MRRIVGLALLATVASVWGCQSSEPSPSRERQRDEGPVASSDDPIVGGTVDTTHDAVVTVLSFSDEGMGACSGTIVAKNGTTGYVLTAGHCEGDSYAIVQNDDWADCLDNNVLNGAVDGCGEVYQVREARQHPNYGSEDAFDTGFPIPVWDFLMLRFSGAKDTTPVIPYDDGSANFGAGDEIELVGFGRVDEGGELVDNTERRHVTNSINNIYGSDSFPPLFDWYQSFDGPGGSCQGDSGGPALHNGYVVGVTSFGGQGCNYDGWAAHVAQVSDFIADFIAEDVPNLTCGQCAGATFANECGNFYGACADDTQCSNILDCNGSCSTQGCFNDCVDENESGFPLYEELLSCAFCDVCEAQCGDTETCNPPGTGGGGPTGSGGDDTGSGAGGPGANATGTGAGTPTSTGADVTSSGTGAPTTGTGTPGGGDGGANGDDKDNDKDDDDGSTAEKDDGCSVGAAGAPSQGGLYALALAGLACVAASRRRRRA